MYGIIFWVNSNRAYPFVMKNDEVAMFDKFIVAKEHADDIEKGKISLYNHTTDEDESIECEVISLDTVKE